MFPLQLQRSAVVVIVDCPDRGQFVGCLSLKQAALQWIGLFQETWGVQELLCPIDLTNLIYPKTAKLGTQESPVRVFRGVLKLWPREMVLSISLRVGTQAIHAL